MAKRIIDLFTSLKLTVACLCCALVVVFAGTLAQVDQGLYRVQHEYFQSLLIFWTIPGTSWKIPVFPGGYLIGVVLLLNLLAAHYQRFQFSRKKIGIFLTHAGLILLLVGQFTTDMFKQESMMQLTEGQSKNYSESQRLNELAVTDQSNPKYDREVTFPEDVLAKQGTITNPAFPFTLHVKKYFPNSTLTNRAPMLATDPPPATRGVGALVGVVPEPKTVRLNERDTPTAILEVDGKKGSLGTWLVSLQVNRPQTFQYEGKKWALALRPKRYYKPYSLKLLRFRHDDYKGTDIPKNFSSRVEITRPSTGEDRQVLIYMNHPLRYAGETYYQSGFKPGNNRLTILQVVHNPSWLAPYIACSIVAAGLLIQFLSHLIGFIKRRRA